MLCVGGSASRRVFTSSSECVTLLSGMFLSCSCEISSGKGGRKLENDSRMTLVDCKDACEVVSHAQIRDSDHK